MASQNGFATSDFELLQETGQGTLFAIKKDEPGVKYIAQPFGVLTGFDVEGADKQKTIDEASAFYKLFHSSKVGSAIAQIFNHENIISIAGSIKTHSVANSSERAHLEEYIVWDYCDASNLSALFHSKPCESTEFYLPESLCWHVLTSLLNAITYLHDGKRLFLDTEASEGGAKIWASVDQDWLPILHRAIEPRNIFFQQPRGIETYGMCKLGNFEHAVVTNHVITPNGEDVTDEHVEVGRAIAPYRGIKALDTTRQQLLESAETFTSENRPYTVADELFSIGSVTFTMMTGRQPTINTDSYLATAQYSDELKDTVRYLLDFSTSSKTRVNSVLPTTMAVMEQYQQWKLHSEEGKLYKDIEDDMAARCGANS
ncbi:kinase-like domain-containing protein [Trichoderma sp. SZMC 28014]